MFLFGFLGSVVVVFLIFGAVILTGYFVFLHIYELIWPGPRRNVHFVDSNGKRRHLNVITDIK